MGYRLPLCTQQVRPETFCPEKIILVDPTNSFCVMKLLPIFGILFFSSCPFLTAQHENADTYGQQVLKAQSTRFSAMIGADVERLKSLLADDLTYTHTTGWTQTKSEFLETIKSGRIDYLAYTPRDVKVRTYRDVAVLNGLVDVTLTTSTSRNEERNFTIRFLEVQRNMEGTWQLMAWESVINQE